MVFILVNPKNINATCKQMSNATYLSHEMRQTQVLIHSQQQRPQSQGPRDLSQNNSMTAATAQQPRIINCGQRRFSDAKDETLTDTVYYICGLNLSQSKCNQNSSLLKR